MNKKLDQFLNLLLLVPPVYYYAGLGAICVGLFAFTWFGNESKPEPAVTAALNDFDFESAPIPLSTITDLHASLSAETDINVQDVLAIEQKTKLLDKEIRTIVGGGSASKSAPLSDSFEALGIDRDRFQAKYADDPIAVQRWQTAQSAPLFRGGQAFEQFIENALGPWLLTSDFRISLIPYTSSMVDDTINVDFVVESFGRPNADQGIQSTSMWRTSWEKTETNLNLKSIRVVAQEEVAINVAGGQILLDYTDSVFQHCDTLRDQLGFGLDQWARKIPNLDIVGNHGLAVGDVNQDGLDDIYVCQPHGLPNRLLIQNPDGTVEDVSEKSQSNILDESHGALMIDIDNDHDQDLIVSTDENLVIMSNRSDGTFQIEHVMAIGRNAHSITAADYDQDGDLDLYLCKYQDVNRQNDVVMFPGRIATADDGGRNVLLRNDEGWKFTDATEECGITTNNRHYSRSAIWHDFDRDGDLDLYVTNEFSTDQLFENQDGWFADVSERLGIDNSARHRSVSLGEFNQDGRQDLFVATDVPLSAYRQLREASKELDDGDASKDLFESLIGENQIWFTPEPGDAFQSFFLRAPVFSSQSAFGSASADLNNDGLDDVIVSNGYVTRLGEDVDEMLYANAFRSRKPNPDKIGAAEIVSENSLAAAIAQTSHVVSDLCREGYSLSAKQRNRCYLSIGTLGFANLSALSGADLPDDARGVATTDWDGDGDADIIMTCRSAPQIRILCNQMSSQNQFVHFDLIGTESNYDAIGARVELFLAGREAPLVKSLTAGSGNLTQSTKRLMFGVGKSNTIEKAIVVWPNGKSQTFTGVEPNRRYEVVEGREDLAEKNNERFKLAISPRVHVPTSSFPPVGDRAIFYPRPAIPNLQFQSKDENWYSVESSNDKPLLAVFWTKNATSESFLQDVVDASSSFSDKKLDCLAVFMDSATLKPSQLLSYATEVTERLDFPFRSGVAAPSTIDKLKYLSGEWFFDQKIPSAPFAVLLDSEKRVAAFYANDDLNTDTIFKDLSLIPLPDWQYRVEAAPLGGRWSTRYRHAKLNRLRTRLKEVGYEEDAEAIFDQTRDQIALELCQRAIELDSQGESARSRSFFDKAIEMDPDCVMAYVGLGQLFRRMSFQQKFDKEESRAYLQQASLTSFEHAIDLDPLNTDAIIGRANIAIDQSRINDALEQLKEFVDVDPTRFEVHAIIGRLLFRQQEQQEAAVYLAKAFENRPSLPYVAGDLGFLYLAAGEYEQAYKFLRLANRLQPSDKNILRLLAEAEFVLGNFDEAAKLFERVTKLDPNRRRAKNVLAWLLATCPYENYRDGEQAMKIMNPMVKLHGDSSPAILEIYAACFAEIGKFDQAMKFQEQAIELLNSDKTVEIYSETQKEGMQARLELFRRKRPYRTADILQIPIQPPGRKR